MKQKRALSLAVCLGALGAAGCGPTSHTFTGTERARGVDGHVEVHDIEGGNREVRLEMHHLPPPDRLGQGLTVYAMWLAPNNRQAVLASFLAYDPGGRHGTARATTPGHRFIVKVTAERSREVSSPSEHVVAQLRVD